MNERAHMFNRTDYTMKAILLNDGEMISLQDFYFMKKMGMLKEEPMEENSVDGPCPKCKSILEKTQMKKHVLSCAGRRSFMRLRNAHPEILSEDEVLWILQTHIERNRKNGYTSAHMPIGTWYVSFYYLKTILKRLLHRFPDVRFTIPYRDFNQIEIRAEW